MGNPIKGKNLKFTDKLAAELYKPVTRKLQRRIVNVNGIDEIWAANLIDMQAFSKDNNGIKYLLIVIDIFSKFVWIIPLKRKLNRKLQMHFRGSQRNEELVKCRLIKVGNSIIKTSRN